MRWSDVQELSSSWRQKSSAKIPLKLISVALHTDIDFHCQPPGAWCAKAARSVFPSSSCHIPEQASAGVSFIPSMTLSRAAMSFLLFFVLLSSSERKTPCTRKVGTFFFHRLATRRALDTNIALCDAGDLFADFLALKAGVRVVISGSGTGPSAWKDVNIYYLHTEVKSYWQWYLMKQRTVKVRIWNKTWDLTAGCFGFLFCYIIS